MIAEQQTSAKIYQFPVGGRGGKSAFGDHLRPVIAEPAMPRGSAIGAGESWYHAEAIEAAQRVIT